MPQGLKDLLNARRAGQKTLRGLLDEKRQQAGIDWSQVMLAPDGGGVYQPPAREDLGLTPIPERLDPEGVKGAGQAFREAFGGGKALPVVGGLAEAEELAHLWSASKHVASGTASPREERLLENFLIESQQDETFWYKFWNIGLQLPAFMVEFAVSGGLGKMGKEAASKGLREAAEKAIGSRVNSAALNIAGRGAARASAYVAGTTVQAAHPVWAGRLAASVMGAALPDYELDEAGNIRLLESAPSFGKAVKDGLLDHWITTTVEGLGGPAGEALGGLFKRIPVAGKLTMMMQDTAHRWLRLHPGSTMSDLAEEVAKSTGWNGVLGEVAEEYIQGEAKELAGLGEFDGFPMEDLIPMVAAFMVPGAMHAGSKLVGRDKNVEYSFDDIPEETKALMAEVAADPEAFVERAANRWTGNVQPLASGLTEGEAQAESRDAPVDPGFPLSYGFTPGQYESGEDIDLAERPMESFREKAQDVAAPLERLQRKFKRMGLDEDFFDVVAKRSVLPGKVKDELSTEALPRRDEVTGLAVEERDRILYSMAKAAPEFNRILQHRAAKEQIKGANERLIAREKRMEQDMRIHRSYEDKRLQRDLAAADAWEKKKVKEARKKIEESVARGEEKLTKLETLRETVDKAGEEQAQWYFDAARTSMGRVRRHAKSEKFRKGESAEQSLMEWAQANSDRIALSTQKKLNRIDQRIEALIEGELSATEVAEEVALAEAEISLWATERRERHLELSTGRIMKRLERNEATLLRRLNARDRQLQDALNRNASLSGMSTETARGLVEEYESGPDGDKYRRLSEIHKEIAQKIRENRVASGQWSQETADHLADIYPNYIPRRNKPEGALKAALRKRKSQKQSKLVKAKGRAEMDLDELADTLVDPTSAMLEDYADSVYSKHVMAVREPIFEMMNNVTSSEWTVDRVRGPATIDPSAPGEVSLNPNELTPEWKEDWVPYWSNGSLYALRFKDKAFGRALNESDIRFAGNKLTKGIGDLTRAWATTKTIYNPKFWVSALERDVGYAGIYMAGKHGWKNATQFALKVPGAIGEVLANSPGVQAWGREGGKVDYIDALNYDATTRALAARVGQAETSEAKLAGILNLGRKLAQGFELGVRYAGYQQFRDMGWTKQQAARGSRDLTVDFERRGAWMGAFSQLYAFGNARIQSFERAAHVMQYPGVQRIAVGMALMAAYQDTVNRAMGGTDPEDGIPYYDKMSEWELDSSMVFMLPPGMEWTDIPGFGFMVTQSPGGGSYVKVRLPWVFNSAWTAGRNFAASVLPSSLGGGHKDVGEAAKDVGKSVWNAAAPIGDATILQTLSPTLADPFVGQLENKDRFGREQVPQNRSHTTPDAMRVRDADPWMKELAQFLNESTGGTPRSSGAIDISPETIDNLWDFLWSGSMQLGQDAVESAVALAGGSEMEMHRLPMMDEFFGAIPTSAAKHLFYEGSHNVDEMEQHYKGLIEMGEMEAASEYFSKHSGFISLKGFAEKIRGLPEEVRESMYDDFNRLYWKAVTGENHD